MKRFNVFYAVLVSAALTACSGDDLESLITPTVVAPQDTTETPILFSSSRGSVTRGEATGRDAANLLGKKFVVFGYKGSSSVSLSSIVFDNYRVEYNWNTAHTTESNTSNWEYVGVSPIVHATNNGITSQKIKYWDYSQPKYDFIGWSTGSKTPIYSGYPAAGQVLVSAISPSVTTTPKKSITNAYTLTGLATDLAACYITDLITVKKAQYGSNPVTMRFRQLGTKVRMAIYETVPGYSVKNVQFYSAANSNDATAASAKLFTTTANDIYTQGTYIVYYPTVDAEGTADNNQAHVAFSSSEAQTTIVSWGALNYTYREDGEQTYTNVYLGRSSNQASFAGAAEDNYYVTYLPNEAGTSLNLRVNYTLESTDGSGEEIVVKGATAQVPSIYAQWRPGYAYTYIFKISDKTNGHTGDYDPTNPDSSPDPAGLYPITFDALVEGTEDSEVTQESITLVSVPSITSYQKGSAVVNNNEYTVNGNDIFVTVNESDALVSLSGKAALYTIPAGTVEGEVIDALQIRSDAATGTIKGRSGLVLTNATMSLTDKVEYAADGNAISVGTNKAARFTPASGKTYAFVYTQTASTSETPKYVLLDKCAGDDVTGLYRYKYDAATGDVYPSYTYYSKAGGVYSVATPAYYGQSLSGYYSRYGAGTPENPYTYYNLSGYTASSGNSYYYKDGSEYKLAYNVAYADFASATDLYTCDGATYTAKTETTPVAATKYYHRTGAGTTEDPYIYTPCVILPQQANGWYTMNTWDYEKVTEPTAASWQKYFDKYTQNNGVYYTKVIKVQ